MEATELTAYCGLYCGDCIRFKSKASGLAEELLNEIDHRHFKEYARVKQQHNPAFNGVDPAIALLEAIRDISCEIPCRTGGDGCGGNCPIIACVKAKGIDGCWQCPEFETCGHLKFLEPFHGEAVQKNLRKIKELGLEHWASHREKCYPWL